MDTHISIYDPFMFPYSDIFQDILVRSQVFLSTYVMQSCFQQCPTNFFSMKRYSCGDHMFSDTSLSKVSENEGVRIGNLVPFPLMESCDVCKYKITKSAQKLG